MELKPCPFCGSADKLFTGANEHPPAGPDDPPPYTYSTVGCTGCNAWVSGWGSIETVVRAWNRRAEG